MPVKLPHLERERLGEEKNMKVYPGIPWGIIGPSCVFAVVEQEFSTREEAKKFLSTHKEDPRFVGAYVAQVATCHSCSNRGDNTLRNVASLDGHGCEGGCMY